MVQGLGQGVLVVPQYFLEQSQEFFLITAVALCHVTNDNYYDSRYLSGVIADDG